MKPRIKRVGFRYICPLTYEIVVAERGCAVTWVCECESIQGYGPTPRSAYLEWKNKSPTRRIYAYQP